MRARAHSPILLPALLTLAGFLFPLPARAADAPAEPMARPRPETGNAKPKADLYGDPLPPGAIARLGTVRFRPPEHMSSFAFSPDGRTVAIAFGGSIQFCETLTGKETLRIEAFADDGHPKDFELRIGSIAFSPDGNRLAAGEDTNGKTIRVWETVGGRRILTINANHHINAVSFSPDGTRLVAAGFGISLWNTKNANQIWIIPDTPYVGSITFSPDGNTLAMTGQDNRACLLDAATGTVRLRLEGHEKPVHDVAFSPDGTKIATASDDETVRLWDASTGQTLRILRGHQGDVRQVRFSPQGDVLVSSSIDTTLRIWSVASGRVIRVIPLLESFECPGANQIAVSSNGMLACGGWDKVLRIWDLATGQELLTNMGHHGMVRSVDISPDGAALASVANDNTIRLWDPSSGKCLRILEGIPRHVRYAAFSPDGKTLATIEGRGAIRLRGTSEGRTALVIDCDVDADARSLFVSYSPDGKVLAAPHGKGVGLWETATGQQLMVMVPDGDWDQSPVAFSPSGTILACASREGIQLFDCKTGRAGQRFKGSSCDSVGFLPDGQRVVAAGGGDVRLMDVVTGNERILVENADLDIVALACPPRGEHFAVGDRKGSIRLYDAKTGGVIGTYESLGGSISSLVFSHDGRFLASGLENSSILVWDVAALLKNQK